MAPMAPVVSAVGAMRRRSRDWWWVPGWLFAAVTVLPVLLAIAWLVPGFAMLSAGRLTAVPMLVVFVPLAAALIYFVLRRTPLSWPSGSSRAGAGPVPLYPVVLTVLVAAGFAAWEALRHSQQLLVAGDPGVYLQYGYWIAKHGTAKIPQSAAAFGGQGPLNFATYGFIPNGSSLSPDFMPGLPLMLAAGTWLHGVAGALLTGPVIAGGAVLSFGGLCGRLAGPKWAPVGALVLALTVPEQYTGRTTLSEPLVQLMLFGGLCLIVDSLTLTRRDPAGVPGTDVSGVAGAGARRLPAVASGGTLASMVLAGIGGFAFGLTILIWIGGLSLLLPAFPVLAVMFVLRRPQAGPLAMGMFLGAACGLFAALVLARPYLSAQVSALHLFGLSAAGFGVLTALIAPLAFPRVRRLARRWLTARPKLFGLSARGKALRLWSAASVSGWLLAAAPAIALAGLAIRPFFQVTRGFTDPYVVRYVAELQHLSGLPADGHRQYYETSLDWVVWYLGVPAVLMACAGTAVLGRRMIRSLTAVPAGPADSAASGGSGFLSDAVWLWGLTYLVVAWSVATVLWDPSVLPGQPSASRRLVPVVLPGLVLLAVWAAALLKSRATLLGAQRLTSWAVGVCCALALVIPAFWSAFAPQVIVVHRPSSGVSASVTWHGAAATQTWKGSVAAVDALCSAIGPNASVVFTDALTADYFAPAVRGMCGQPATLVVAAGSAGAPASGVLGSAPSYAGPSSAALVVQAVSSIERAGRHPVLLGASESTVGGFGVPARLAVSLQTRTDPQVLNGPPAGSWPFAYSVWIASGPGLGSSSALPGSSPALPGSSTLPGTSGAPTSPPTTGVQGAPGAPAGA